jgi:hypothetical protein
MTYLRRSVYGWKLRREILFFHMDGSIIYGLDLHLLLRRSTLTHFDMYFVYFRLVGFLRLVRTAVCILVMQRLGVFAYE